LTTPAKFSQIAHHFAICYEIVTLHLDITDTLLVYATFAPSDPVFLSPDLESQNPATIALFETAKRAAAGDGARRHP
jgi:hypothetical protein